MTIYDPAEYVFDLRQWLYSKRDSWPGCELAAMQLPCIRTLWGNGTGTNTVTDLTAFGHTLTADSAAVGVDMEASWPGVFYWFTNNAPMYAQKAVAWPGLQITHSLTIGAWVRAQATSVEQNVMQWGEFKSYGLAFTGTAYRFDIKPLAGALMSITSADVETGAWYFVVGRYTASTEMSLFVNMAQSQTTVGIPGSLGDGDFFQVLGPQQPSASLHVGQMWVSACSVPTHFLQWLFAVQAPRFGAI